MVSGVRIGCGLSLDPDPRLGAIEAAGGAREGLGGEHADLALVFCCGAHLAAPEATLEGVHEGLEPAALAGCGAGGVLGAGREVERGTAVTVWAAALDGGTAETFAAGGPDDLPDMTNATGALLFPDPYSFPSDLALGELQSRAPGVPVLGGLSSARTLDGSGALLLEDRVLPDGAVGVRFTGIELLPCVSQGAAPVGPELVVTAADAHVLHELDGVPAIQRLQDVVLGLDPIDRELVGGGLLLGLAVDSATPGHVQRDFLVRGVLGADPDAGSIAVGEPVEAGQVLRVHARDARSADRDLRESLELRHEALGGRTPAGALVFTCNGRGQAMFGVGDHDVRAVADEFGSVPAAGFFAAGEIGPVAGRPFLHGFTATVAVFVP